MMQKILVSTCLLGQPARYDGEVFDTIPAIIKQWVADGRVIAICPEVAGGLPIPRPPAEIIASDGPEVLAGRGKIRTFQGQDVTEAFCRGAFDALALVKAHDISIAVLKGGSPSCGNEQIHNGLFNGEKKPGQGVTAALLMAHGVAVYNEKQLDEVVQLLTINDKSADY